MGPLLVGTLRVRGVWRVRRGSKSIGGGSSGSKGVGVVGSGIIVEVGSGVVKCKVRGRVGGRFLERNKFIKTFMPSLLSGTRDERNGSGTVAARQ